MLLVLNAAAAFAGILTGTVSRNGAAAGFVVGAAVAFGLRWPGWLLLFAAFALTAAATRVGRRRKEALGIAEPASGARGARQVLANSGAPAALALFSAVGPPSWSPLVACAFCGALATTAADTVSSEIGKAWGGRTRRLHDLSPAPPGTPGGISAVGTAAGAAAAALVALGAAGLGLASPPAALAAGAGGFAAALLEGLLAPLEAARRLDNDSVNAIAVAAGAGIAAAGFLATGALAGPAS